MEIKTEGLFYPGERVAVALSGGKDSVMLFDVLLKKEKELNIEVLAINVEHGIRGVSSVSDSFFVKKLCDNAGKRLLSYSVDAPAYARQKKMSLETAARDLRYKCFFGAIKDGLCDKIATAHHADDDAESVLLNIFRGSGAAGLSGIAESSYDGKIVRPMLSVTRKQIDAYIEQNRLDFVTDETNFDTDYSRNFIRNRIIPVIEEKFPDFRSSLKRLGKICKDEDDYILSVAKGYLTVGKGGEARLTLDRNERNRPVILRAAIEGMKKAGMVKDYELTHAEAVASLMDKSVGASVDLPHGFVATRSYNDIIIEKKKAAEEFSVPFSVGEFTLPGGVLKIEKVPFPITNENELVPFFAKEKQKGVLYAADSTLFSKAVIRNRKQGDRIKKFGGGEKSLKEFLIDLKIEGRRRDILPICAVGCEVLFVAGAEISSLVKADGGEIYKITYEKI